MYLSGCNDGQDTCQHPGLCTLHVHTSSLRLHPLCSFKLCQIMQAAARLRKCAKLQHAPALLSAIRVS